MEEILRGWGVDDDTIQIFKDEKINLEVLKLMSDEELKEIVPYMGARLLIKKNLKELPATDCNSNYSSRGLNDPSNHGMLNELQALSDELNNEDDVETVGLSQQTDGEPQCKRARASVTVSSTSTEDSPCPSYDLEALLKSSGKGKMVLADYMKGRLCDTSRSRLADIIICNEVQSEYDKRITTQRAKFLAEKVILLFPTEVLSVWYREETRPRGEGRMVKGRILTKYYNQRRNMIKCGLIDKSSHDDSEDEFDGLDVDDPENCDESLAWLRGKNVSPWPRVESAWQATSKYRLRRLQNPEITEDISEPCSSRQRRSKVTKKKIKAPLAAVNAYVQEYPQLLQSKGWELPVLDFDMYQKDASFKLSSEYPKLEKFVLDKLREKSDFLFDDEMSEEVKCAHILLSLSKLFPVMTIANKRGATCYQWRPSRQEVRDSFLLHVKAEGALQKALKSRAEKLKKFDLTLQPQAVIISKDLVHIEKCYVCIDTFKYELPNPLIAIDVVFKLYHSLHAQYPADSEPL